MVSTVEVARRRFAALPAEQLALFDRLDPATFEAFQVTGRRFGVGERAGALAAAQEAAWRDARGRVSTPRWRRWDSAG